MSKVLNPPKKYTSEQFASLRCTGCGSDSSCPLFLNTKGLSSATNLGPKEQHVHVHVKVPDDVHERGE